MCELFFMLEKIKKKKFVSLNVSNDWQRENCIATHFFLSLTTSKCNFESYIFFSIFYLLWNWVRRSFNLLLEIVFQKYFDICKQEKMRRNVACFYFLALQQAIEVDQQLSRDKITRSFIKSNIFLQLLWCRRFIWTTYASAPIR